MSESKGVLQIKRIYAEADPLDGFRVLVDRVWPRGVTKERAQLDMWDKEIAPSPDLRKWWNHDPARMEEFAHRYRAELDKNAEAVDAMVDTIRTHSVVTLLYGAHDPQVNHALILKQYLEGQA